MADLRVLDHGKVKAAGTSITRTGTQTVDGISCGEDEVVYDLDAASDGGPWVAKGTSGVAWTRPANWTNAHTELGGSFWHVEQGTANGDKLVRITTNGDITVDTTSITSVVEESSASLAAAGGAALIGTTDAGGYLTTSTVEGNIQELAASFSVPVLTAGSETTNVIPVTVNIADIALTAKSAAVTCLFEIYDATTGVPNASAFTIAETGAGTEIAGTGSALLIATTDASGDATISITDVVGASGKSSILVATPVGLGLPQYVVATFD